MLWRHAWLGCCLLALLVSGCAPTARDRLVGRWDGKIDVDQQAVQLQTAGNESPLANSLSQLVVGGMKAATLKLDFQDSGQMELTFKMGPFDQSTRGTWEVVQSAGEQVTIQSTDERGNQKQFELTFVGPDEFTMRSPTGDGAPSLGTVRFRRVTEP